MNIKLNVVLTLVLALFSSSFALAGRVSLICEGKLLVFDTDAESVTYDGDYYFNPKGNRDFPWTNFAADKISFARYRKLSQLNSVIMTYELNRYTGKLTGYYEFDYSGGPKRHGSDSLQCEKGGEAKF